MELKNERLYKLRFIKVFVKVSCKSQCVNVDIVV